MYLLTTSQLTQSDYLWILSAALITISASQIHCIKFSSILVKIAVLKIISDIISKISQLIIF